MDQQIQRSKYLTKPKEMQKSNINYRQNIFGYSREKNS